MINALYHAVHGMRGLVVPTTVAVTGDDLAMDAGLKERIIGEGVLTRGRAMIGELLDIAGLRRARAPTQSRRHPVAA